MIQFKDVVPTRDYFLLRACFWGAGVMNGYDWRRMFLFHHKAPDGDFVAGLAAETDAYGHTTGNTPEDVRFQKLSLVRPN